MSLPTLLTFVQSESHTHGAMPFENSKTVFSGVRSHAYASPLSRALHRGAPLLRLVARRAAPRHAPAGGVNLPRKPPPQRPHILALSL